MAHKARSLASGTVTGTGSAITIKTEFRPKLIHIFNRTRNTQGVWSESMPDASAQLTVDSGSGTTDLSFITSNGITPTRDGFTLGSNSSLNTASDVIYWTAHR